MSSSPARGCSTFGNASIKVSPLNLNSLGSLKLVINEIIDSNYLWKDTVQNLRSQIVLVMKKDTIICLVETGIPQLMVISLLRIQINNQIHYGWIRLVVRIFIGASFTIKDYAFNSSPNQPILAGDGGIGGPLPLTFLSFDGVLKNNQAYLTWTTVNEINNKGFDVERSTDGQNFFQLLL